MLNSVTENIKYAAGQYKISELGGNLLAHCKNNATDGYKSTRAHILTYTDDTETWYNSVLPNNGGGTKIQREACSHSDH